jgi:ribosomal subunit interface protein
MRLEVSSPNIRLGSRVKTQLNKKLAKIQRLLKGLYFPKDLIFCQVKIDREPVTQYRVIVTLVLPSQTLRVKTQAHQLTTAINEVGETLTRKVERYKAKITKESTFREIAKKKRLA